MSNSKSGRTMLRPLPGQRATGVCQHSMRNGRLEATVSAQSMVPGASLTALLQYGPQGNYRCLAAEPLEGILQTDGPMPSAVWVLDRGNPILFGRLSSEPFDMEEAKGRLHQPAVEPKQVGVSEAIAPVTNGLPAATDTPVLSTTDTYPQYADDPPLTEADTADGNAFVQSDLPLSAAQMQADNLQPTIEQDTLDPYDVPAVDPDTPTDEPALHIQEAYDQPSAEPEQEFLESSEADMAAASEVVPYELDETTYQDPPPLVIQRAPRFAPPPPVYSPLWDDVSAEFEKMLDALPTAKPFHSRSDDDSQFAQLPLGGEVQCYIGSVLIEGKHVFLQAVPSRPYGRPAGFDHTLVARDGSCYWVKYFIEDE